MSDFDYAITHVHIDLFVRVVITDHPFKRSAVTRLPVHVYGGMCGL